MIDTDKLLASAEPAAEQVFTIGCGDPQISAAYIPPQVFNHLAGGLKSEFGTFRAYRSKEAAMKALREAVQKYKESQ